MKSPTWRAEVVSLTATRSPSPIMSSIVKRVSARAVDTRPIAAFRSSFGRPVDGHVWATKSSPRSSSTVSGRPWTKISSTKRRTIALLSSMVVMTVLLLAGAGQPRRSALTAAGPEPPRPFRRRDGSPTSAVRAASGRCAMASSGPTETRRRGLHHVPPIGELTRIEQVHLDRLEHQGIFTTGLLLEVSETPTRRQTLADQVGASTNDVLTWRDEALMLNLASFGPEDHQLLMQAGIDGLHDILGLDLDAWRDRLERAATELNMEMPDDLTIAAWWEQARTLAD